MNKKVLSTCTGAALLALCASPAVFAKGHVPIGQVQVCVNGDVLQLTDAMSGDSDSDSDGACILPSCDFNNVFQTGAGNCASTAASGDSDSGSDTDGLHDDDSDGLCDLPNPRKDATGITPGCTGQY